MTTVEAAQAAGEARPRRLAGAVVGLLAAAVALGIAELLAGATNPQSSPVVAVGAAAVDAAPEWLKHFAIRAFGENDKLVLLSGVVAVVAALAAWLGVAFTRRPRARFAGIAALGVAGAAAALARPDSGSLAALPSLLGAAAGAGALVLLARALPGASDPGTAGRLRPDGADDAGRPAALGRRRFVTTSLVLGGAALGAGAGGRALAGRVDVAGSRARVRIPAAASPAGRLPADAQLAVPELSRFFTPNRDFYRVDTALILPRVPAEQWRLRVHGRVRRELELDYGALLARGLVERDITLTCVSNEVGGPYVGTARWLGAPLAELLREAGVEPGADQLVSRSADGFTAGTPVAAVLDGRDALLAVAMNGEPLPVEHGFPVRMVVPGLYGYVSATKWLVDLELTTFSAFDPYWVRRGWSPRAPIKVASRIDTPRPLARVRAGRVAVAGVAWAQRRGVERVEVRVDGGDWRAARLAREASVDTWRQWVLDWDAAPGRHTLEVRATDRDGTAQPERRAPPFPDGATGWHSVVVTVA